MNTQTPTVRAKFRCDSVVGEGDSRNVNLSAVYDPDKNSENGRFFTYTPSGQITLSTVNPGAWKAFTPGKEYYIDFTPTS